MNLGFLFADTGMCFDLIMILYPWYLLHYQNVLKMHLTESCVPTCRYKNVPKGAGDRIQGVPCRYQNVLKHADDCIFGCDGMC